MIKHPVRYLFQPWWRRDFRLFWRHLSMAQKNSWLHYQWFFVETPDGDEYAISPRWGRLGTRNVHCMRGGYSFDFAPYESHNESHIPMPCYDVMLAQKLHIEAGLGVRGIFASACYGTHPPHYFPHSLFMKFLTRHGGRFIGL